VYSAEQHLISSAVPTKNLKREIRRTISLTCSRVFHLDHGVHWSKGDLKCGIEHVRKALSDFAKISFHPGWIPDRFQDVDDWKFSFVHIDADWPEPTSESLAFSARASKQAESSFAMTMVKALLLELRTRSIIFWQINRRRC